ncbi:hypothetical protein DICPUDRAFT_159942 [Dictyostelium purpureum]|uniref:Uncharacterized protein n=1 Tax=Dictyostelium purpureum TaxID=5786 RepID=F1A5C0_DICPU|nr:uncharacterized protein DICPUDRAFT_159942 [Dictyostelium purpureum]EGC28606.1 hypothetical protein DICPUDRAFT_159942 [Dictyostelium purpureum]|eukprot:XP_003294864.1 hypothetical protein DICPUDRAFT_159942 [Dictyostelium purpureum]
MGCLSKGFSRIQIGLDKIFNASIELLKNFTVSRKENTQSPHLNEIVDTIYSLYGLVSASSRSNNLQMVLSLLNRVNTPKSFEVKKFLVNLIPSFEFKDLVMVLEYFNSSHKMLISCGNSNSPIDSQSIQLFFSNLFVVVQRIQSCGYKNEELDIISKLVQDSINFSGILCYIITLGFFAKMLSDVTNFDNKKDRTLKLNSIKWCLFFLKKSNPNSKLDIIISELEKLINKSNT